MYRHASLQRSDDLQVRAHSTSRFDAGAKKMGPKPYVRTTHKVYDDALFHLIAYLEKNYYTYLRTSILNCSQIVTCGLKMGP